MTRPILLAIALCFLFSMPVSAGEPASACKAEDRLCVLDMLEADTAKITDVQWRDVTYRELAKTLAFDGQTDRAMRLIARIGNPDTQAMTIRGIGMAVADNHLQPAQYDDIFRKLRAEAEKIKHPPSYAIALTYIAMSQAFAGDDVGAAKTAHDMENQALRNKAFGESAEIQADRGDFKTAMESIANIDDPVYRNKSHRTVSEIFSDRGQYQEALDTARKIDNDYMKADAIQYMLDRQKPRDVKKDYEKKETRP